MINVKVTRPALRYYGGKWRLAQWILRHFPEHRIYIEPYGGAASVLLQKRRSYSEVYNDLDGEIVNVFRVLREPASAARLRELIELTPYAREEFMLAATADADPVEQARRTIVRSFMGHGSDSITVPHTGFRSNANRNGSTPAHDWMNWPAIIPAFVNRLRAVIVEHRPALEVIAQHDRADALIYADPPYVHSTRCTKSNQATSAGRAHGYRHEMTDDDHRALAHVLRNAAGAVVLSGYRCDLYDELYGDWQAVTRGTFANSGQKREEVLWLSPRCAASVPMTLDLRATA